MKDDDIVSPDVLMAVLRPAIDMLVKKGATVEQINAVLRVAARASGLDPDCMPVFSERKPS